jgi:transcription antitermination factor NusG
MGDKPRMLARTENPLTEALDFRAPRKWFALLTVANKEQAAADWIRIRSPGTWIYWPNISVQVSQGRNRRRQHRSALIPGYLFMAEHLNAGDPWPVVHDTPGIRSFVRDSVGRAASLSDADIEIIRRIEGQENLPQDPKTAHRFKSGDKVRFIGDLYGRWPHGRVSRLVEDGRIVVEVSLLGQTVPILVRPSQIKAM